MALYIASKANLEFSQFNIDDDIDPLFKVQTILYACCICFVMLETYTKLLYGLQEYWCKRLHPKNVAEKVYRQPPLRISLRSGRLNKQDFKFTKHQTTLLLAADSIGKKIQYNCRGFLPNQRQVCIQNRSILWSVPYFFFLVYICKEVIVSCSAPLMWVIV